MARLFILIKRKGSKRFLGAIPTRKGATMVSLRRAMPKQIKKGFMFKIVTQKQLKAVILRQRPKTTGRLRRKIRRTKSIRGVKRRIKRRRVRRIRRRRRKR